MKRIVIILVSFFILDTVAIFGTNTADDNQPSGDYQPIGVKTELPNLHRSVQVPIYAYYMSGAVILDFMEDFGLATVSVRNLTTGSNVVEIIDTGMGNVLVDIGSILAVSDYYMSITTMSGNVYYAEFSLE